MDPWGGGMGSKMTRTALALDSIFKLFKIHNFGCREENTGEGANTIPTQAGVMWGQEDGKISHT